MGQANRSASRIQPKAVNCGIIGDKCRPEVAGDVMSGVDQVGVDVHVKFGDSLLNSGRLIHLCLATPVLHNFVQYLITFYIQPESASDVISATFVRLIIYNNCVKCRDPCVNRCGEI